MQYTREELIGMLKIGKGSLAQVYKTGCVRNWQVMFEAAYKREDGSTQMAFISPAAWGEAYIDEDSLLAGHDNTMHTDGTYRQMFKLVPWTDDTIICDEEARAYYYVPMKAEWEAHKIYMKENPWGGTCTVSRLKKDGTPDKRCKEYKVNTIAG